MVVYYGGDTGLKLCLKCGAYMSMAGDHLCQSRLAEFATKERDIGITDSRLRFSDKQKPKNHLNVDRQIRIAALNAAVIAYRNGILREAQRMENYIRTGEIEK